MSYGRLSNDDFVISSEVVSVPIWSDGSATLTSFASSSAQAASLSGEYYLDVYKSGDTSNVQFSIAYCNKFGSGSTAYNPAYSDKTRSKTTYGQFRSLVLGSEESEFRFLEESGSTGDFWALTVDRARYRECLIPGSLNLVVNGKTFIENTLEPVKYLDSGRVYDIVQSGSTKCVGYFLPDIGTVLLDCHATGITTTKTPTTDGNRTNNAKLIASGGMTKFTLKSQETVSSNYVFVRAKNSEFNYSMNPSFVNSVGELNHSIMINSPETFITSVGLYNDNNDLLAVAKLSKPLAKDFTKEALIRVKLDY